MIIAERKQQKGNNLYQILTTNKKGGISTIEKKKV
jgi:hypothetical protein